MDFIFNLQDEIMAITDLTNLTNANQTSDIIIFLNQNSDGLFLGMFVVAMSFIFALIMMRRTTLLQAIWTSCGITTILCFLLMLYFSLSPIYFILYLAISVILTFINYAQVG